MGIYEPAEDSFLLSDSVKEYLESSANKQIRILDMGTGSGIQAKICKNLGFKNILAVDINQQAVKELKKQKIKAIYSNLFSKINKKDKFDLIIFNPPYLPEDKAEPKDSRVETTAGKQGYELIIQFLKQAKSNLKKNGRILLLFSSLSKPDVIKKQTKALGYSLKQVNKKKLFFEELYVYKIKRKKVSYILYTSS